MVDENANEIAEADVKAAANTPTGEVFAEVRDRVSQFKTSSILLGVLLEQIRKDKKYTEKGLKTFDEFIASIGLSMQTVHNLINVSTVLSDKFPEVLKQIADDPEGAYLPGNKAMYIANSSDLSDEQKEAFTKPNSIKKLREVIGSGSGSDSGDEDIPIEKIAKSSKIFTKKVENSCYVPDDLKTEVVQINAKFQKLSP